MHPPEEAAEKLLLSSSNALDGHWLYLMVDFMLQHRRTSQNDVFCLVLSSHRLPPMCTHTILDGRMRKHNSGNIGDQHELALITATISFYFAETRV